MAIAIVVGNVIGAGIFLKPGEAAAQAGSAWLAITAWVVGGVLSLLGALTIAELALRLPKAGGLYIYLREGFGRPVGFLFGWSEFVFGVPASIGALAAGLAGMGGVLAERRLGVWQETSIAIVAITGLAAVNILGVIWGGRAQVATTAVKCLFIAALAALPLVLSLSGHSGIDSANYHDTLESVNEPASAPTRFAGALLAVLWAYSGWHAIAPVAEEVKSPRKNIPLALVGGSMLLTGLYVAVVLAYHGTLPMREIRDAGIGLPQVMTAQLLSPFGDDVASIAVKCISIAAIISIAGSLNSNLMSGPRVGFAMARDGVLPAALSAVHARYRTPAVAISTQAALAILLVLGSATLVSTVDRFRARTVFDLLTDCVTFIASIFLMLAVAAIFPIRRRHTGDAESGYTIPFFPWLPLTYIAASLLFIVYVFKGKPVEALIGVALTVAGLPVYWWMTRSRSL